MSVLENVKVVHIYGDFLKEYSKTIGERYVVAYHKFVQIIWNKNSFQLLVRLEILF